MNGGSSGQSSTAAASGAEGPGTREKFEDVDSPFAIEENQLSEAAFFLADPRQMRIGGRGGCGSREASISFFLFFLPFGWLMA